MDTTMKEVVSKEVLIEIIKPLIAQQLESFVREHEIKAKEVSLLERLIRVEEELRDQREVIASLLREMNARFEAVDKRFEAMDKRFEALQRQIDSRFGAVQEELKSQKEIIASLLREMNVRFEAVDKRFEAIEKRMGFMQWFMGFGFSFLAILITLINFLMK